MICIGFKLIDFRASVVGALFIVILVPFRASSDEIDSNFIAEQISAGALLYEDNCARCHGVELADPVEGIDLRTFPLDQRNRFMNSVANGKNSMPPWRSVLSDKEIGDLFAYVVSMVKGR